MSFRALLNLRLLVFLGLYAPLTLYGQARPPYTNQWISDDQPYVKLKVSAKGIHRVAFSALPAKFSVNRPEKLQLWHRGSQVAILSVANNEILFYGVPNDGSTDSLLYRPMNSRMNPYVSMYSDVSAYFLTVGKENGLRAKIVGSSPVNGAITEFHQQTDVQAFSNEYSLSTLSPIRANFFNSFFEKGASKTGVTVLAGKSISYNFKLTGKIIGSRPLVSVMVHGRSNNARSIEVYAGKNENSVRKVGAIANAYFTASKYSFVLEESDLNADGSGLFVFKSVASDKLERFSVAYYSITYDQRIALNGQSSKELNFPQSSEANTRFKIADGTAETKVYDITSQIAPRILEGKGTDLSISRTKNSALRIYLSNKPIEIAPDKISNVDMVSPEVKKYDYIIITSQPLEAGAVAYAEYRKSAQGGSFAPLVVKITDVYNQFNFGEPSPIAIRRFVDYMLSDGNREKNLFLIGSSTTFNERMVRELPNEVPTIGFPGSDILLVEGLAGAGREIAAVPIGRLAALNNKNIYDYLEKVKEYEQSNATDQSWKKNILHLNGGKSSSEITQLKNILAGLAPIAEKGYIGGKVKPFVKQQGISEVETVNITPEINSGVGLLTYFGHGSPTITDLDFGYITDVTRAYNNQGKYPLMYFNGCGVGNVFSGRTGTNPSSSNRIALSQDWILAPKHGTVAIMANTFSTYVSPTKNYLEKLYSVLFEDPTTSGQSIGKIQIEVAKRIFANGYQEYDVANAHQALLQGDPALKMAYISLPDYKVDNYESITIYSESVEKTLGNSTKLRASVVIKNSGKYFAGEKLSVALKYVYQNGTSEVKYQTVPAIPNQDTVQIEFPIKGALKQIEVKLDQENSIRELSESNNIAELLIDWEQASAQYLYPIERVKDLVHPVLDVTFNDRMIQDMEAIGPLPKIQFELSDDRLMSVDTNLMEIFVKPCADNNCDFQRIAYRDLKVRQSSDRSISVEYGANLSLPGVYEVLVNTKDVSGNSPENPYQIKFQITQVADDINLVCSPNPATDYVRFRLTGIEQKKIIQVDYTIYDVKGIVQAKKSLRPLASVQDWYWTDKLRSGSYIYKAVVSKGDGSAKTITGRLNITN
ncbi:hypothetical protein J2Y45_006836 [Dyadobacter sp. BE34]|uniref:putative type IX secretion system sortase PorU2 n=1 Tax=Dyadobacter TaxID=120831 RepID=UPI002867788E|nr:MULTISPECIES: C25 family cysteine peptidase [Dyadobacter]MDR7047502.1 hypothetical protein [Dyadobacter sp. BE242]MDR7201672.1 hypothetical protein [Dyadobacter sp. BE34]MDR7219542.1 hypothetical protein [Dyadobacter sp. BE31]